MVNRHEELIRQYFADNVQLAASSLKAFAYIFRHFFKYLEERAIDFNKITTSVVNDFYLQRLKDCSRKTANYQLRVIFYFLDHLYWEEVIPDKEWRKLERQRRRFPKARGTKIKPVLEREEVEYILWHLEDDRARACIWILYRYGLRPSEVANLKDRDVDLKSQTLTIEESKHNRIRQIPIPTSDISEWTHWLQRKRLLYSDDICVIPNLRHHKEPLSTQQIGRLVKKAEPLIGKRLYPYIFRYTVATLNLEEGATMDILAGILGHKSTSTTERYAQRREKTVRERWLALQEKKEE